MQGGDGQRSAARPSPSSARQLAIVSWQRSPCRATAHACPLLSRPGPRPGPNLALINLKKHVILNRRQRKLTEIASHTLFLLFSYNFSAFLRLFKT
jgi:hypothetical protein